MRHIEIKTSEKAAGQGYSFVLGKNGLFLSKNNCIYAALLKLNDKEIPALDDLKEKIELTLKIRIPFSEIQKAVAFFRTIRRIYGREAILIIYFNPKKEAFQLYVPLQDASSGHVQTKENIIQQGDFIPIGTIHSHPGAAFHSTGDVEDEKSFSGIHITCGDLEREKPSWVASLVVHGRRIPMDPHKIMELDIEYPAEWFKKISLCVRANEICGL